MSSDHEFNFIAVISPLKISHLAVVVLVRGKFQVFQHSIR